MQDASAGIADLANDGDDGIDEYANGGGTGDRLDRDGHVLRRRCDTFDDSDSFDEDSDASSTSHEFTINQWRGWRDDRTSGGSGNVTSSIQLRPSVGLAARASATSRSAQGVQSLIDLACIQVATHLPFELVERQNPPVSEELQLKIATLSFPDKEDDIRLYSCLANGSAEEFNAGKRMYLNGAVSNPLQIGFHLCATIQPNKQQVLNTCVKFDRRRISTCECSCSSVIGWCSHVTALCLFRIYKPSRVKMRAPISESLSRLDVGQLRKFSQYFISKLPQNILAIAQAILDDLLDESSEINAIDGAPDPTLGGGCDETPVWCLNGQVLQANVKKILVKFCRPAPTVCSDVTAMSLTTPLSAAEWTSFTRPLRGCQPEGMWNLLSIVRQMLHNHDANGVQILRAVTQQVLDINQILIWWFEARISKVRYYRQPRDSTQASSSSSIWRQSLSSPATVHSALRALRANRLSDSTVAAAPASTAPVMDINGFPSMTTNINGGGSGGGGGGNAGIGGGNNSASAIACAYMCDEIVSLWTLVLNTPPDDCRWMWSATTEAERVASRSALCARLVEDQRRVVGCVLTHHQAELNRLVNSLNSHHLQFQQAPGHINDGSGTGAVSSAAAQLSLANVGRRSMGAGGRQQQHHQHGIGHYNKTVTSAVRFIDALLSFAGFKPAIQAGQFDVWRATSPQHQQQQQDPRQKPVSPIVSDASPITTSPPTTAAVSLPANSSGIVTVNNVKSAEDGGASSFDDDSDAVDEDDEDGDDEEEEDETVSDCSSVLDTAANSTATRAGGGSPLAAATSAASVAVPPPGHGTEYDCYYYDTSRLPPSSSATTASSQQPQPDVAVDLTVDAVVGAGIRLSSVDQGGELMFYRTEALYAFGYPEQARLVAAQLARHWLHHSRTTAPNLSLHTSLLSTFKTAAAGGENGNRFVAPHLRLHQPIIWPKCKMYKAMATTHLTHLASTYLHQLGFVCTVLADASASRWPPSAVRSLDAALLTDNNADTDDSVHLTSVAARERHREYQRLAFRVGMLGLLMGRPPASCKPMEVKLFHQESQLAELLRTLPLEAGEIEQLCTIAGDMKRGALHHHRGQRGQFALPLVLAKFIFESLVIRRRRRQSGQEMRPSVDNNSDATSGINSACPLSDDEIECLAFEAAMAALSARPNVSEADHPLLCEGTRRARGDLSLMLLLHYRNSPEKVAAIMDRFADRKYNPLFMATDKFDPLYYVASSSSGSAASPPTVAAAVPTTGHPSSSVTTSCSPTVLSNVDFFQSDGSLATLDAMMARQSAAAASGQHFIQPPPVASALDGTPSNASRRRSAMSCAGGRGGRVPIGHRRPLFNQSSVGSGPAMATAPFSSSSFISSVSHHINEASEAAAHYTFELAKTVLDKAGGNTLSTSSLFSLPTADGERAAGGDGRSVIDGGGGGVAPAGSLGRSVRHHGRRRTADHYGGSGSSRGHQQYRQIPSNHWSPAIAAGVSFDAADALPLAAGGGSPPGHPAMMGTPGIASIGGTMAQPHRGLQMAAFQIGLYALGMHNRVSPSWLSRTYSGHVSWITAQAIDIGSLAIRFLVWTWPGHLTPAEAASLADKASKSGRRSDEAMQRAAAYLTLSVLPHASLLSLNEIQRAIRQCKEADEVSRHQWQHQQHRLASATPSTTASHSAVRRAALTSATSMHESGRLSLLERACLAVERASSAAVALTTHQHFPQAAQTQATSASAAVTAAGMDAAACGPPPPLPAAGHPMTYAPIPPTDSVASNIYPEIIFEVARQWFEIYEVRSGGRGRSLSTATTAMRSPPTTDVSSAIAQWSNSMQSPCPPPAASVEPSLHHISPNTLAAASEQTPQVHEALCDQMRRQLGLHNLTSDAIGQIVNSTLSTLQQAQQHQQHDQQPPPDGGDQAGPDSGDNNTNSLAVDPAADDARQHLLAAYRVGMLGLETLAFKIAEERPQARFARTPSYADDVKWLLSVAQTLGLSYMDKFFCYTANIIMSPFLLQELINETATYLLVQRCCSPNDVPLQIRMTPFLAHNLIKCCQLYNQCLHHKLFYVKPDTHEDFIAALFEARKPFMWTLDGGNAFDTLLNTIRRSKLCKKDLWLKIVAENAKHVSASAASGVDDFSGQVRPMLPYGGGPPPPVPPAFIAAMPPPVMGAPVAADWRHMPPPMAAMVGQQPPLAMPPLPLSQGGMMVQPDMRVPPPPFYSPIAPVVGGQVGAAGPVVVSAATNNSNNSNNNNNIVMPQ